MNKQVTRKWDRFGRGIVLFMWLWMQIIVLMLTIAMIQENVIEDGWYMLLMLSALWSVLILVFLSRIPAIELTPEGVYSRILLKKRFYPWSTIKQVGILWSAGRYGRYNALVLLKSNGSKRKFKDKTFAVRNFGKLIHIPQTRENKNYILKYYGPLDFDLSEGRDEASVVVDERISADGETESNT